MLPHDAQPHKPQCFPRAPDTDPAPVPEPDGTELFAYKLHALFDRLILIGDHLQAIDNDLIDIAHHQDVIHHHFIAVKDHLEREALP